MCNYRCQSCSKGDSVIVVTGIFRVLAPHAEAGKAEQAVSQLKEKQMDSLEALTTFFGWCAVINTALLLLAAFFLAYMRGFALNIHTRMFALSEEDVLRAYFQYLAQYKILALVFSVVPYVALRLTA